LLLNIRRLSAPIGFISIKYLLANKWYYCYWRTYWVRTFFKIQVQFFTAGHKFVVYCSRSVNDIKTGWKTILWWFKSQLRSVACVFSVLQQMFGNISVKYNFCYIHNRFWQENGPWRKKGPAYKKEKPTGRIGTNERKRCREFE
jgi:hypothetical protein